MLDGAVAAATELIEQLGAPLQSIRSIGIRAWLRRDAAESPFLQTLRLDERIELLPADSPVAAIGAALLSSALAEIDPFEKEMPVHG
ncbi:hypothetical protein [Microbacterium sp. nov. GSS16]|uniref:hypothetical protein n=1 Tax=Microbacterium sp. nov. GSS16 TaxID=3019890 RepID=UPI0023067E8B|nr:hypothetical protein [Microbacterium sp. nov. GSS16]WCD92777.1 hypothetical protein PGB26_00430 [Microbacterium sp. nov. GSS16]